MVMVGWLIAAAAAQMPDPPRKLFSLDMATIDVIVRREGDRYYAILKDERYPTLDWNKYSVPAKVRHGSMIPITRKQYDAMLGAFNK